MQGSLPDRQGDRSIPGRAEFKSMLQATGLWNARPHDARHTAATLLLEQRVDIRRVQETVGHSTLAVTKRCTRI